MYARLALLTALALALTACGGSQTNVQTPAKAPAVEATAAPVAEATAEPPTAAPANQAYKVGDAIPLDGGAVFTVQEVKRTSDGKLALICLYDNSAGSKDATVSSIIGFDVKDGDGNKAKYSIAMGDGLPSGLDGTVIKGDKLRGALVFDTEGMSAGLKLYYKPEIIGDTLVLVDLGQ